MARTAPATDNGVVDGIGARSLDTERGAEIGAWYECERGLTAGVVKPFRVGLVGVRFTTAEPQDYDEGRTSREVPDPVYPSARLPRGCLIGRSALERLLGGGRGSVIHPRGARGLGYLPLAYLSLRIHPFAEEPH